MGGTMKTVLKGVLFVAVVYVIIMFAMLFNIRNRISENEYDISIMKVEQNTLYPGIDTTKYIFKSSQRGK